MCVDKVCVSKLCGDKLCGDKRQAAERRGEARRGGVERRKCTIKNKNPTQRCGKKHFSSKISHPARPNTSKHFAVKPCHEIACDNRSVGMTPHQTAHQDALAEEVS